jgi:hypothetical protein
MIYMLINGVILNDAEIQRLFMGIIIKYNKLLYKIQKF